MTASARKAGPPLALALWLAGCAVGPAMVAYPGPGKDPAAFQADDTACHAEAVAAVSAATTPKPVSGAAAAVVPAQAYARCMTARGDRVGPPPQLPDPYLLPGAGVYSGFGDTFPWEYGF